MVATSKNKKTQKSGNNLLKNPAKNGNKWYNKGKKRGKRIV
nr:MAG TPA: hypothetical protein [Caudoviricetes sp.]